MSKFQTITSSAELDYPKVLPTLDLNFAATKTLDPRITFTRSSGGTYVDETGIIRIAGVNQPRFDHNPLTGECLGLLVEESRSNNQSSSNVFSSGWNDLVAVTLQNNLYPDPFGTNTATRIIPTTTSTSHYIGRYQGYSTGAYAHSVFLKPAGYSRVLVDVNGSTFTANLSGSGSFTNNNSITYATKIQAYSNGWYRLEWIWNNTGGGGANTLQPRITILDNSGNSTFAGDGVSGIDFFGYQQEVGLFCTSYIPTGASALARAADNASITGTNFSNFYKQAEGTIYIEGRGTRPPAASFSERWYNGLTQGASTSTFLTEIWNGSVQAGASVAYTPNTQAKFAVARDNVSPTRTAKDGVLSANAGLSVITSVSSMTIGNRPDIGPAYMNGTLTRVTYWPARLSDRYLQRITEP